MLVHVMDVSNPVWQKQEMAVLQVLDEIGAGEKPIVRVMNKIDLLDSDIAEDLKYDAIMQNSVAISALSGDGIVDFVGTVEDAMLGLLQPIEVLLPYSHGKEVSVINDEKQGITL